MANNATATAAAAEKAGRVPRLSGNFPRVPPGCEKVAESFFACFYEHGKPVKDAPDAEIGNKALVKCAPAVEAYNSCVDKAAATAPKRLFRVPEAYRVRDE